jgi:hypothetical protein
MKTMMHLIRLIAALPLLIVAAESPETKPALQSAKPKFIIYSAAEDAELAASMIKIVFRAGNKTERILKADSIAKAVASDAEVLILVMPGDVQPTYEPKILELLKKRKVIGIGPDAARLFGKLGLEIHFAKCDQFGPAPPDVQISKSRLLGLPKSTDAIPVYLESEDAGAAFRKPNNFGMLIPPESADAAVVDVIARFVEDSNYAPIVRQGNFVLIGLPASATQWTDGYSAIVQETSAALCDRKLDVFSTVRRELTGPGTYEFQLPKSQRADAPDSRKFFFRFTERTQLNVRLDRSKRIQTTLQFTGSDENSLFTTADHFTVDISQKDIDELVDRCWVLEVTNSNLESAVDYKLKITCEKPIPVTPEIVP